MLSYWQVILPFSLICQADGFMRVQGLGSEESSHPGQDIFLNFSYFQGLYFGGFLESSWIEVNIVSSQLFFSGRRARLNAR
jgi:hypothetical protein